MTCEKKAFWDVEIRRTGCHVPVCDEHKKDAAVELSRKGELLMRPFQDSKAACAYEPPEA